MASTSTTDAPWHRSAAELRGLLELRDGVERLAVAHEAKARQLKGSGRDVAQGIHAELAQELRALLRGEP